jgi:hypothetical protein
MKTTKIFATIAIAAISVSVLAGCIQTPEVDEPRAIVTSTPEPTAEATEAPVVEVPAPVADPVEEAQKSSGLTVEQYVAATAQVQAADFSSKENFNAATDAIAAEFGKPVVVIAYYECPRAADAGVYTWAIAGALMSPQPKCGVYPEQLTREGAIGAAEKRAERNKNTLDDYILLFIDNS